VVRREQGFSEAAQMLTKVLDWALARYRCPAYANAERRISLPRESIGRRRKCYGISLPDIAPGCIPQSGPFVVRIAFPQFRIPDARAPKRCLRHSEERMRAILDSALDCVITMDHQEGWWSSIRPRRKPWFYRAMTRSVSYCPISLFRRRCVNDIGKDSRIISLREKRPC